MVIVCFNGVFSATEMPLQKTSELFGLGEEKENSLREAIYPPKASL